MRSTKHNLLTFLKHYYQETESTKTNRKQKIGNQIDILYVWEIMLGIDCPIIKI